MINVICDGCNRLMNQLYGSKDINGYQETYECTRCNILLDVRTREIPIEGSHGKDIHPICPNCAERHAGICEKSWKEPVKCCEEEPEKCQAPESTADLERRMKRLEFEKRILDLEDYIHFARERERVR